MTIKENCCKSFWVQLFFVSVIGMFVYNTFVYAEDAEEWMPDGTLRNAVREQLQLPDATPMHTLDMMELRDLVITESDIENLQGLEHAVNLRFLHLSRSQIVDITPLSGLMFLKTLKLNHNQIIDITPLSNLVNLEHLRLHHNQIIDFTPLLGLINLKSIRVTGNPGDVSPILALNVAKDWECLLGDIPISERVEDRSYPSVFQTTGMVLNLPTSSFEERIAQHDLYFKGIPHFDLGWTFTSEGVKITGDLGVSKERRYTLLDHNPNMVFLVGLYYYGAPGDMYPEDWPHWIRDASGNRIQDPGYGEFFINFTHPVVQDLVVQQAIAIAKCGLYEGIFLDLWHTRILIDRVERDIDPNVEIEAKLSILKRIREAVGDDFLILVNTVRWKVPRSAPYVNGTHMETQWDPKIGFYTRERLTEIDNTLLWSEENFRYPQINCLSAKAINENLDTPANQRWMRTFTTMSLTHSDGYVLYDRGISHEHYWYDFWDAPLGQPIGGNETKGQLYENREGLFIREFTNGYAVYNRSGKAQEISIPIQATGAESGITSFKHTVPDLDGEIYLKTGVTADVNGDGVVNIQDLVIVANALGKAEPDLNGDGVVNIQDLVIVANAF